MDVAEFPEDGPSTMEKQLSLWLDPKKQRSKVNITQFRVGNPVVMTDDSVVKVGVNVDENLSMDKHIVKVSRAVCV